MRRRRASELYQVDFVAALFGGFLLVWLSGISEAEFPGNDGKQLVFVELSSRGFFDEPNGTGRYWASFLPVHREMLRCAHTKVVELATSFRKLIPCTKSRFELPLTLPDGNDFYDEFVLTGFIADTLQPGTVVYFPVVQECERGVERWIETPNAGQNPQELKSPAPALRVVAPRASTGASGTAGSRP
jgi:hypothetical protein